MEDIKNIIRYTVELLQIQFDLYGYKISIWNIILFVAFASVVIYLWKGLMK
jgi:hypothetical protein